MIWGKSFWNGNDQGSFILLVIAALIYYNAFVARLDAANSDYLTVYAKMNSVSKSPNKVNTAAKNISNKKVNFLYKNALQVAWINDPNFHCEFSLEK